MLTGIEAQLRVAIITSNPAGIYSGGRYLSLIMAYSLARVGESVVYATDNMPMFDADFAEYDANYPIEKVVEKTFSFPDLGQLDWVIVIPTGGISDVIYSAGARIAGASGARISLMSFESPNWFNSLAPSKRSGLPWEAWRKCVAQGGLVLTIAREGVEPARKFYRSPHHRAALEYAFWHPPINDLVADKVPPAKGPRDRIVTFVRTQDPHKGAADLLRLDPEIFAGKLLSPVFGRSVEEPYVDALKRHFSHAGVAIEPHDRISDREKFELLAEAQLLLFPSYFEGFGYPVVEAAYMGVPSVAYDLPVVRETVGEAATYVAPGDHEGFSRAIAEALKTEPGPRVREKLRIDPDTLSAGLKLQRLLKSHIKLITPFKKALSPIQVETRPRDDVLADSSVQSHWRAALAGHRFRDVEGVVSASGLSIAGKVETSGKDATLQVVLEGKRLPVTTLVKSAKAETKKFEFSQPIGPVGTIEAQCRLELVEQGKTAASQIVPLRFTAETLFRADRWAGGAVRQAFGRGGERVLLVSEFNRLVAGGRDAFVVAELAARFRARGLPVTLALESDQQSEPFADSAVEADLLPLVDMVETVSKGFAATMSAPGAAVAPGVTLAAPLDLAPGLAEGADLIVKTGGVRHRPIAVKKLTGAPAAKTVEIDFTPTLLASRSEARAAKRRLVIVGAAAHAKVEAGWRRLFETILPRAAAELPVAEILVNQELLGRSLDPDLVKRFADGSGWSIASGDFPALVAAARGSAHAVGVDVGDPARDGRIASLAASLDLPAIALATADDAAAFDAIRAALAVDPPPLESSSPLGAALAAGWPLSAPGAPAGGHALARAAIAAENVGAGGLVHVPSIMVGETLALSAQSDAKADFLISGWSPRYVDGATMSAAGALIAFGLKERPNATVTVELLIRSKAPKNTMLKCAVTLNGHDIGVIALDRPISKLFPFQVPARFWRPSGVQLLAFRPEPAQVENEEFTPQLLGLSLMVYPSAPDWSAFDKDRPIVEMTRISAGAAYPIRLAFRGEGSDHAALGRGWGAQEPWHVWSVEPVAAVMTSGEPADGKPALVTIEAGALITDTHPSQRLVVEANGETLGERRTVAGFPTRMAFAAPPSVLELGLEGLILRMPDCVRPKALGLSTDARELGVSLTELSIEIPDGEPARARIEPGPAGSASARFDGFTHGSAVLKLAGTGDGGVLTMNHPQGETRLEAWSYGGRWEAWIGLVDLASAPTLSIRFEPDENADLSLPFVVEAAELWPVGEVAERPIDVVAVVKSSISFEKLMSRPSVDLGFGSEQDSAILTQGWSVAEGDFRWSEAPSASVDLSLVKAAHDFVALRFDFAPFLVPGVDRQVVRVSRGGVDLASVVLAEGGRKEIGIAIDPAAGGPGVLTLHLPNAISPQALGYSADTRQLAVQIFRLAIDSVEADRVARVVADALKEGWSVARSATTASSVIVELEGPSDGAPSHVGLAGSGVFAVVTPAQGRAQAALVLPKRLIEGEDAAVLVEAFMDGYGGMIVGDAVAEVRLRVREDA